MSRCLGLTDDRWRCPAYAVEGTAYCEKHQLPGCEKREQSKKPSRARGVAGLIQRLRPGRASRVIPDPSKFSLPGWAKRASTTALAARLLSDPGTLERWTAAFALRKRRDPSAIEPLWQALSNDPVSMVRQQAAVALGKIGTPEVRGPLVEALWHDADAGVRQASVIALGNLRDPAAVRDLVRALADERAVYVRWDCVLALGELGDLALEPVLTKWASREPATVVRRAYHQALERLREKG